jgi:hypothetical protein
VKLWERYRDHLVELDREKREVSALWAELRTACSHPKLPPRTLGEEYADTCPDCGHVNYCYTFPSGSV